MDTFSMEGIQHESARTTPRDPLALFTSEPQISTPQDHDGFRPRQLAESLSAEEQATMSRKVTDIFDLGDWQNEDDVEMDDAEESIFDVENQEKRTESLKAVLPTIAQMWWADSEQMDVVTEKLADASRDRKFQQ